MFENMSPKQAAHLRYGCRKRCTGAILGLLNSLNNTIAGTVLQSEYDNMKGIIDGILSRAEKERDLELQKADSSPDATKVDLRAAAEQRQFNGK